MNIVYGGSFNPPTLAHEKIVDLLIKTFNPKNIIIVPTADNYTWKNITNFSDRFNMAKIAFPKALISDIENQNVMYKGTYYTLDKLSIAYKDIYFCMGADNLINIKKWINYTELLNKYHFIVFKRDNIDIDLFINNELNEYKEKFIIVDFNEVISSTMFRINKDTNLVSKDVLEYIKKNKLYQEVSYE